MIGTFINVFFVIAGSLFGLWSRKDFNAAQQNLIKNLLGVFSVWIGLKTIWSGLGGGFGRSCLLIIVSMVAMSLSKFLGKALGLQTSMNKLGKHAKEMMQKGRDPQKAVGNAFLTGTILFCTTPMAVLGAFQESIVRDASFLVIKSIMDGLAAMAFARMLGSGIVISALPVLAFQGTLTLLGNLIAPWMQGNYLVEPFSVTLGLLIMCAALIVFGFSRIELANYLLTLIITPLLFYLWLILS
jgi:uncharacterized membrane protein YqgA involved in biofilm formation